MSSFTDSAQREKSLRSLFGVCGAMAIASCVNRPPELVPTTEAPRLEMPAVLSAGEIEQDAGLDVFEADAGSRVGSEGATPCPIGMVLIPGGRPRLRGSRHMLRILNDGGTMLVDTPPPPFVPDFCIDALEVTLAAYRGCVAARRCAAPPRSEHEKCGYQRTDWLRRPMICATYVDASAFCKFVGKVLPTPNQWERAGGWSDGRTFPWGNAEPEPGGVCWFRPEEGPCDVGTSTQDVSPFGVYDMAGNASERLTDPEDVYAGALAGDLQPAAGGSFHITRDRLFFMYRGPLLESGTSIDERMGFRCVKELTRRRWPSP